VRYLSVCSGIEAASAAWHPLGWTPVAFSEVDKFPSAVLAHHYPDVPNWGDMTKFKEWPDADVDVLVGGTPCQSFSVAGLRKGMDDPRGNLALTYLAIADRYKPTFLCWENVPGVLSSNGGRDFGAILGGMVKLGYGVAYRVLDAQFFGVPQRRRRVFVVGHLGDWRRAAAVLFEHHSLQGHPPPRRKARQTAPTIPSRRTAGGGLDTDFDCGGGLIHCADVAPTLNAHFGDKQGFEDQHINGGGASSLPEISHCLNAGGMRRQDYETETLIPTRGGFFDVAHSLRGEGFDVGEDGTGRGTPLVTAFYPTNRQPEFGNYEDVSPAIKIGSSGSSGNPPAIAFSAKDHGADAGEVAPTLRSMGHDGSHANGGGQVAVAFMENVRGELRTSEVTDSLQGSGGKPGQGYAAVLEPVTFESRFARNGRGAPDTIVPPLKAQSGETGKGDAAPLVAFSSMQVRRLTPRECERLQGFPDDYTLIPWRGGMSPDGPRYKALGNSMAVPCMRFLGERIQMVSDLEVTP